MQLTMKDRQRVEVIEAVMDERITVEDATKVLNRSVRQIFRLLQRLRTGGLAGLIHGNRGRVSPRKTPTFLREKVLRWARGKYHDVNDRQFCELLTREEGLSISRETLRRLLRAEGLGPKRKRRRAHYRKRRERKAAFGMMVQIDASPHDWLEGRGPWLTLVGGRDDATNHTWAQFEESESLWGYFHLVRSMATSEGLPWSLYSDRHTIFFSPRPQTIEEQLRDHIPRTQFGRAMEDLGITLIGAHSPQAKGRIERCWGVLQDRLVVELRLANAKTRAEANAVLEPFLLDWNVRFTVPARQTLKVFRPCPAPSVLDRFLSLRETRTVQNDHTVSFQGLILQIPPSRRFSSLARRKVTVLQLATGEVRIEYQDTPVASFSFGAISRLAKNLTAPSELKRAA